MSCPVALGPPARPHGPAIWSRRSGGGGSIASLLTTIAIIGVIAMIGLGMVPQLRLFSFGQTTTAPGEDDYVATFSIRYDVQVLDAEPSDRLQNSPPRRPTVGWEYGVGSYEPAQLLKGDDHTILFPAKQRQPATNSNLHLKSSRHKTKVVAPGDKLFVQLQIGPADWFTMRGSVMCRIVVRKGDKIIADSSRDGLKRVDLNPRYGSRPRDKHDDLWYCATNLTVPAG